MATKKEKEELDEKLEMEVKEKKKEIVKKVKTNIKEVKKAKTNIKESKKVNTEIKKNDKVKIGVDNSENISLEEKKKALLQRAAELRAEKTEILDTKVLKEEVKASKKRGNMLVDLEEYVKTGIYLGTRVVTPDMKRYVYRRRADGLAIFNTDLIDEKLKEGIKYLSKFKPEDVILVCKRQSGWKAAELFSKVTGIKVFTKKYPVGVMTNIKLRDFFETELSIITDAWLDKNALKDTLDVKKNVLMICGTNNFSKGANQVIIGNNKSGKSIGLIFYLLARGYCKERGIKADLFDRELWTGEDEE